MPSSLKDGLSFSTAIETYLPYTRSREQDLACHMVRPENGVYDIAGREDEVIDIAYGQVSLGGKAPNGQQLRPHIVFFGEAVPNIEKAIDLVERADILLTVGSSLQVYPAAGLYRYAHPGVPVYIIDPKDVPVHDPRLTHIRAVATKGMQEFIKLL